MADIHRPKRQFSDDEKANALMILDANNGSATQTAKDTGIKRTTIQDWEMGIGINPAVTEIRLAKRGDLAERFESRLHELVDSLTPERMSEATIVQIATCIGILTDKMQILRGEPNSITQANMTEEEKTFRLAELLTVAQARRREALAVVASEAPSENTEDE